MIGPSTGCSLSDSDAKFLLECDPILVDWSVQSSDLLICDYYFADLDINFKQPKLAVPLFYVKTSVDSFNKDDDNVIS